MININLYNSWHIGCKRPFGAVRSGETVIFSIYLPKNFKCDAPTMLLYETDQWDHPIQIPMTLSAVDFVRNRYTCSFEPPEALLYFYCFEVLVSGVPTPIKMGENNEGVLGLTDGGLWQLTVFDRSMAANSVMGDGAMYQIFPDRFYSSGIEDKEIPWGRTVHQNWDEMPDFRPDGHGRITNSDYFGGDLKGIEQKLPYLAGMGVTSIYLNPIFEAHSNHRYNTADYRRIDPLLGTEEDFVSMCAAARELGISVILDGVFSHTGSDSLYFNRERRYGDHVGACNDRESPYSDWYQFSNWPHEYDSWWGFDTLPNVNETCPSYMDFICGPDGVLAYWMDRGARGWRLDVADELPDDFLDAVNRRIKSYNPDFPIVGEVWEDASTKVSYGVRRRYLLGKQMDSVMNYPFKNAILNYIRWGSGVEFYKIIMSILERYPQPVISSLMNFLSTHDIPRAITMLVGEELRGQDREWQNAHHLLEPETYRYGLKLLKLSYLLLFGMPGHPCVYYGDEAGVSGYRDPFNRTPFPWGHENHDLTEFIGGLGRMRKESSLFRTGTFCPLTFEEEICSFVWQSEIETLFFAVNRSNTHQKVVLPPSFEDCEVLLVTGEYIPGVLSPLSGVVLHAKSNDPLSASGGFQTYYSAT